MDIKHLELIQKILRESHPHGMSVWLVFVKLMINYNVIISTKKVRAMLNHLVLKNVAYLQQRLYYIA